MRRRLVPARFASLSVAALTLSLAPSSLVPSSPAQDRPSWPKVEPQQPEIAAASEEGAEALRTFRIPSGLRGSVFAAEPDVANVVALHVDHQGRVWACETFRQSRGIEDNRGNERWLDDDLSAQTVQDRYDYILKHVPEAPQTYTAHDDRIRLLVDQDGDHVVDRATVFADRFNDVVAGTGAGVLSYRGDVFYTCIPDLWRLRDADGDGVADERTSLHYGFGVRFAFRGHDMHGLTIGPDGRLYFSIGDRGYNVVTEDGRGVNPESGAVFRCELDGSRLEVVAMGLRNPQELAFDDFGNLFTGDNNSDSGDQARWVLVLPGGDTGWRMSYQYLPDRGPFNREKLWQPPHPGQPAYIVPCIRNFADGPSELTYYPGTGLSDDFKGRFLLCDFRGQASNSGIRSFRMVPKRAGFEMADEDQPFWNILATDADFGPDGALYVADWVHGWEGLGKGRIYRFSNPELDGSAEIAEMRRLLSEGLESLDEERLTALLGHADRRLRQEAQFELVRRGNFEALEGVARSRGSTLSRVHAIWGLGQLARGNVRRDDVSETIAETIRDRDPEVRAQSCAVMGELDDLTYGDSLIRALADPAPRVRAYAAYAVGQLRYLRALDGVLELLAANADSDPYLRHAGIMALTGIGSNDRNAVVGLESHPSAAVRLAAVVALRKNNDAAAAVFLDDADPLVGTEAARAVYDLPLTAALPELAASLERAGDSAPYRHRVLAAAYRLGGAERAELLAAFAARPEADEAASLEALDMLGAWSEPNPRDRVLGMYRPIEARPNDDARTALDRHLAAILGRGGVIAERATDIASRLGIEAIVPRLAERLTDSTVAGPVRAAALRALAQLQADDLRGRIDTALASDAPELRAAAADLLVDLDEVAAVTALMAGVRSESLAERRAAIVSLGRCRSGGASELLMTQGEELARGRLPAELTLEVIEALEAHDGDQAKFYLREYRAGFSADDPLAEWRPSMLGGDPSRGRQLFFERASLSCVRCHTIDGVGGLVGPDLSRIGLDKNPEYLLEAIVVPNKAIAQGFEGILVQTIDGTVVSGIVRQQDDEKLVLLTAEGNLVTILQEDVEEIVPGKSSMPDDLTKYLTRSELRDLVAYLAERKSDPADASAHGEGR